MSALLSLATTATLWLAETGPSQEPVQKVPDSEVTPGWIGFLAIFFVGVATLFLIIDMVRRIRRTRYRAEIREQIAVERAEAKRAAEGLDDELRDGGHHGPTSP
ncbi:hypothetical protein [Frondihabitans australicus]|uniref:Uncharacterized protein n=1 Tax=Frondihabitans australicus TaxID=386892 RepID=A0A495IGV8_9MICO|nr:hypothetical protein [Frondihabitans australicus]RKR74999.1 hypothetical protein C8E83_2133 [Frondihabitans australicus]